MPENEMTNPEVTETPKTEPDVTPVPDVSLEPTPESAEIARLKAENARQKAAFDKAAKEAAEYKKALRAKQTAEEVAAEEKRIADEERDQKLAEYEKRWAMAEISRKILPIVGEEAANEAADCLYGAADVDGIVSAFNKAWTAREKALRAEYGRIPAPGTGGVDGEQVNKAVEFARKRAQAHSSVNKNFSDVMGFYK